MSVIPNEIVRPQLPAAAYHDHPEATDLRDGSYYWFFLHPETGEHSKAQLSWARVCFAAGDGALAMNGVFRTGMGICLIDNGCMHAFAPHAMIAGEPVDGEFVRTRITFGSEIRYHLYS